MSTHPRLITLTIVFILTACGKSEPTVPSAEPITDPATAALMPPTPTQTHVSPTDIKAPIDLSIDVPQGDPATIDGTLSPSEWDGAREEVAETCDSENEFQLINKVQVEPNNYNPKRPG